MLRKPQGGGEREELVKLIEFRQQQLYGEPRSADEGVTRAEAEKHKELARALVGDLLGKLARLGITLKTNNPRSPVVISPHNLVYHHADFE